jgi:hypothetical protein
MSEQKSVKIAYRLTEAGRRACLLAGGDGKEVQIAEVPLSSALLELATVRTDGSAWIYATAMMSEHRALCGEKTVHFKNGLLCNFEDGHDGSVRETSIEAIDVPPADVAAWVLGIPWENRKRQTAAEERAAQTRLRREAEKLRFEEEAARNHEAKVRERARQAAIEEQEAAAAAAAAAEKAAKRAEWIRAHGSERLRKALELGLIESSLAVYREERLAHEYPGWVIDNKETEKESEIRNPSLAALAALEEARKISPDACLVKVRPNDDDEDHAWREAVRIDDLPGIESSKVFYRIIEGTR